MKCRDRKGLPRYMQTSPPHTEEDVNGPYWRNPTSATYWIRSDLRVVLWGMTRIRISMSYWSKWNNLPPCRYHNVQQRIVGYKDGGNSTEDLEILIYRTCSAPAMCGRMMLARWNITILAKISRVTIVRQDHHTIPVLPVS